MAAYYIDPERCFEVPFRIPLPDRDSMALRLANILIIVRNARERQSRSCAEHRQKLSTRTTRYRDKAKAIMECGPLRCFVGNLTQHYFDYLEFHREHLNDMSPLTIQVPSLCSPLSPAPPYLFGPPRQGDYNAIIRSNLSWSQFAAPAPAGWREQFLQQRQWELQVEYRAWNVYSEEEREDEYAALESQRRRLEFCLRTDMKTPPPLQRKLPIPLPPITLSPLPNTSPFDKSECLKYDHREYFNTPPSIVQGQLPVQHLRQKSPLALNPSRQRPSLHVVIPGADHFKPWLTSGLLCYSPLSAIESDVPHPSILLNANDVRAYLNAIHGPHNVVPEPESLQLAYPQSLRQQLFPDKLVAEISAEQMSSRHMVHLSPRKSLFASFPDSFIEPSKMYIHQPRPMYALKRQASSNSFAA
ncbi:hypothetical protein BGW80DRAFT_1453007 [Lactifluus volemus]|nr:hypothetical protein BGW80DRAFT_1453007 [Lactifluus volemus]